MITPLEQAADAFRRMNPDGDFTALLAGYLARGYVYSGDDAFILAMPTADAWFIHLAAGDLGRFQAVAPFRLPFISWQRRGSGSIRRYAWDRFARLVAAQRKHVYGKHRFNTRTAVHG